MRHDQYGIKTFQYYLKRKQLAPWKPFWAKCWSGNSLPVDKNCVAKTFHHATKGWLEVFESFFFILQVWYLLILQVNWKKSKKQISKSSRVEDKYIQSRANLGNTRKPTYKTWTAQK
jgi:hypothetical protein